MEKRNISEEERKALAFKYRFPFNLPLTEEQRNLYIDNVKSGTSFDLTLEYEQLLANKCNIWISYEQLKKLEEAKARKSKVVLKITREQLSHQVFADILPPNLEFKRKN